MNKSDQNFWNLMKEIAGLQDAHSKSAPSPDELVSHFAKKMSNAADIYDNDWKQPPQQNAKTKLKGFRVSMKRVLRSLRSLDCSKSINGVPNIFLKECATQLTAPLTKLLRHICKKKALFQNDGRLGVSQRSTSAMRSLTPKIIDR
jgi:hypothetical protein